MAQISALYSDKELIVKMLFDGLEDYTTDQRGEVRSDSVVLRGFCCPDDPPVLGRIACTEHMFREHHKHRAAARSARQSGFLIGSSDRSTVT